jgi:predicted nucleotidyltransferase
MRADWARLIVAEITSAVGQVEVLLIGSRAVGDSHPESDCDVVVLLPLYRIPRTLPALEKTAARLSAALGIPVSINPVPVRSIRHPRDSLYLRKVICEGRMLSRDGEVLASRGPSSLSGGVSDRATESYLLSALNGLLAGLFPGQLVNEPLSPGIQRAILKCILHIAQLRLLAHSSYESRLDRCLARLGDPTLSQWADRPNQIETFSRVSQQLLDLIGPTPIAAGYRRAATRNAQYVALSMLRRRWRVGALLAGHGVEADLALSGSRLLRALRPGTASVDQAMVQRASESLPGSLRPAVVSWSTVRAVVLDEWPSAHPLVGLF